MDKPTTCTRCQGRGYTTKEQLPGFVSIWKGEYGSPAALVLRFAAVLIAVLFITATLAIF